MTAGTLTGPPGTRTRPRRRWIWILVALATIALTVVPFGFRLALKIAIHHQLSPPLTYGQPVSVVEVDAPDAEIVVRVGHVRHVTVATSLQWLVARPSVRIVYRAGRLRLNGGCQASNPFEDCQVSLVITVPAGLAVRVQAGGGSIAVSGLTGPAHLSVTSGSIAARNLAGPVQLTAGSGSISATDLRSADVAASVSSGSLWLTASVAPRQLAVSIGAGSGRVLLPAGTRYRVAAHHGPGTLRISTGLLGADSRNRLSAQVGMGALAVGYRHLRWRQMASSARLRWSGPYAATLPVAVRAGSNPESTGHC